MIGRTVTHYRILEELGRGGMGVVYQAEDLKLGRIVALKFLPPEMTSDGDARRRFVQEARAASALEHTNVCNIHDVDESEDGRLFIVMARYEGETLRDRIERGPLHVDEALDIAIQVAGGLAVAHAAGIVHRDIKPGNIFITNDREVKILDFGLARLSSETRYTKSGSTLGTAAYMSPEQAEGNGDVDARTDVWSLGVVLYEVLTGKLPFRGDAEPAIVHSIFHDTPELLTAIRDDVATGVEEIVERALSKDAARRFANADEMKTALLEQRELSQVGVVTRRSVRWKKFRRNRRVFYGSLLVAGVALAAVMALLIIASGQSIDTIAVLPMVNLSGDPEQEGVADGMTIELITKLGNTGAFKKVVSWTSVRQYKDPLKSLPEIALELGVKAVVEGSMLRTGDIVQLNIRLSEARTESPLWGESYEREFSNVLVLQNDVTLAIVNEIRAKLTGDARAALASARPVNDEAFELYLRGKSLSVWLSFEDFEKARNYLERAIEKDPTYAPAYAALAAKYAAAGIVYYKGPEIQAKMSEAVTRALELDPSQAEAHMAMGMFRHIFEWDWEGAEAAFMRALELDPMSAPVHAEYGSYLSFMARFDEALAELRQALYLAPVTPYIHQYYGIALYKSRRWDESIAQFHKLLELLSENPSPKMELFVHLELSWNYIEQGKFEEALAELEAANTIWHRMGGEGDCCPEERARIYVRWGKRDQVAASIDTLLSDPGVIPWTAAMLGDNELAFRRLEEMYAEHNTFMLFLKNSPELDNLRSDPRYDDLLRRMNFPE